MPQSKTMKNLAIKKVEHSVITEMGVLAKPDPFYVADPKHPLFKGFLKHGIAITDAITQNKKLTKFQKELIYRHLFEMTRLNNNIIRELNFETKAVESKV